MVALRVPSLSEANSVFEFAATAPGTYQTMNIGRFVRDFMAYDTHGAPVATEQTGTNEWRLSDPERVRRITYRVLATRDTTVSTDPIYPMCGTALNASYALINGQGVFGFPRGMQAVPLTVRLKAPAGWTHGTPLVETAGVFTAANYDRLVDSPILLGPHLTRATLDVTGVPVTIVVRALHNDIVAAQLRDEMRDMLNAAGAFLGKLPVDHYTFLYDFGPVLRVSGAWEHSYGSEYVLADLPYTANYGGQIRNMAAHEFFHVETPLNLHSEIIEHFNFATPIASQHLWLYEGTTEWAAHKMQLVAGLVTLPAYLEDVIQKARSDRTDYDTTWSLQRCHSRRTATRGSGSIPTSTRAVRWWRGYSTSSSSSCRAGNEGCGSWFWIWRKSTASSVHFPRLASSTRSSRAPRPMCGISSTASSSAPSGRR